MKKSIQNESTGVTRNAVKYCGKPGRHPQRPCLYHDKPSTLKTPPRFAPVLGQ